MPLTASRRALTGVLAFALPMLAPAAARAAESSGAQCAASYAAAQLARQRGRLIAARDAARACALAACPAVARTDCTAWSAELDRAIPSIVVVLHEVVTGSEVQATRVVVDGVARPDAASGRAIELDPGEHTLHVERAGDENADVSIAVFQGEHDRIVRVPVRALATPAAPGAPPSTTTTPEPPSASPRERPRVTYVPAAIVLGGSVVALGASAWLGLTGRSDLSDLHATCAPACRDDQIDPVRRRLLLSDVTLGLGAVAAGISIYLFARPPATSGAATTLDVGAGSLGLRGSF